MLRCALGGINTDQLRAPFGDLDRTRHLLIGLDLRIEPFEVTIKAVHLDRSDEWIRLFAAGIAAADVLCAPAVEFGGFDNGSRGRWEAARADFVERLS
jgi:hypothetical protein